MGVDARMQAMLASPLSDAEIKLLSARLCRELGQEHFFLSREKGQGALSKYQRYGDPAPADLVLEVSLRGRYYGPGYERGNWMVYIAVAEWLEFNIPGVQVFYGGDSQDELDPFGEVEREELKAHAFSTHSRDYFDNRERQQEYSPPLQDCKLCVTEYYVPQRFGFGGGYAAYYCAVCGYYFTTRDSGKTWESKNTPGEL